MAKQNVKSVIIDLRTNGGGALTEAVSLSGLFIPSGPVVQVRDNNGKVREDADTDGVTYYKARWWCWSIASAPPPPKFRGGDAGLRPRADCRRADLR